MAPRKNIKWQVNEAVMDSSLHSDARLLMFVFSDLAEADTGIVPDSRKERTSNKELARCTGLDEATVKRQKGALVDLGWLKYRKPTWKQQSAHETGAYMITVGKDPERGAPGGMPNKRKRKNADPEAGAHAAPPDGDPVTFESQDPGAQPAPPAGAHGAPPNDNAEGQPGAHAAPPGGAASAPPGAHAAPPIKGTPTPTSTTDILFGSTADAAAPDNATAKPKRGKPKTDQPRPDVEALCNRLAELMIANECKPPTISQRWRDETRRMLDRDGRDFTKAMRLLEWSQQHRFWRSNIHSMPKFREQYDQLRLQANAEWERHHNAGRAGPDWNAVMARAEARDAAEAAAADAEDDDEPLWKRALPA